MQWEEEEAVDSAVGEAPSGSAAVSHVEPANRDDSSGTSGTSNNGTDQLGGANATLVDVDYAYRAYHIGGYAGTLTSASHDTEDSFTMLQLWHHQWPEPILRWVDHCARSILPSLHKIRRAEGHRQCDISDRTLSLIILSVSWLHAFVSSPLPHSFLELFNIALRADERATDAVTAHLEEVVQLEGASEACFISLSTVYFHGFSVPYDGG